MRLKDADILVNSVFPDQTASLISVCTNSDQTASLISVCTNSDAGPRSAIGKGT